MIWQAQQMVDNQAEAAHLWFGSDIQSVRTALRELEAAVEAITTAWQNQIE